MPNGVLPLGVTQTWINQMADNDDTGSGLWLYVVVSIASFLALLVRTLLITSGSLNASKYVSYLARLSVTLLRPESCSDSVNSG